MMRLTRADLFIEAMRVPATLKPQEFGLWYIERRKLDGVAAYMVGWKTQTLLRMWTDATLHSGGYIVMEDSVQELRKHLPILMVAKGRVLVSGLGLGCVVRGLLSNAEVEHVDVLEIDAGIIRAVGPEFAGHPRVTIHHANAMTWPIDGRRWDFAWHDVCTIDDVGLHALHVRIIKRFLGHADRQGAWAMDRICAHVLRERYLGLPRTPRNKRRA